MPLCLNPPKAPLEPIGPGWAPHPGPWGSPAAGTTEPRTSVCTEIIPVRIRRATLNARLVSLETTPPASP
jgi:hypothetical protein